MIREALYHRPTPDYSCACRMDEVQIRFRTARNDAGEVWLCYGVKFDWEHKKHVRMVKIHTDEYFDYYQYNIVENDIRLGYYFEVNGMDERIYYTEAGILDAFDDSKAHTLFFQYPSVHRIDLAEEPSWVKDAVFYEIFVERFDNGSPDISPEHTVSWDSEPTPGSFYGGDLAGITGHLDYLRELGINAVYLTPIFRSVSNHKYDTIDYMEIDEHFGSKEDFKKLVDCAHEKGIRVMLDAVFNHCSENFAPFQDVLRNGSASRYRDWFILHDYPVKQEPPNYETFARVPYMPRFNTANEDVKEYLFGAAEYWTTQYGVDGWRLDVADEPDHWFWRDFRRRMKGINKDLYIVGENWHDSLLWLMGDQFDGVMNYPVTNLAVEFFARGNMDPVTFSMRLASHLMRYPEPVNKMQFNLLDSHDTERFLYLSGEKTAALKNAAAFLIGYMGVPCIYYGTEVGMTGGYDPGCRRGFPWKEEQWDRELLDYFRRLLRIRKEEEALKQGDIAFISSDQLFIMKRFYKQEAVYIVINRTCTGQNIPGEVLQHVGRELLNGGQVNMEVIPPDTAYYLK